MKRHAGRVAEDGSVVVLDVLLWVVILRLRVEYGDVDMLGLAQWIADMFNDDIEHVTK